MDLFPAGARRLLPLTILIVSLAFAGVSQAKDPVLPANQRNPTAQLESGTISGSNGPVTTSLGTVFIGTNFTSSSIGQSGFIPPDTMGAVGPNHVVELINGRYAVYDKSGTFQTASSLNSFWTASGVTTYTGFTFDPRVVFDPHSQRWFAAAVDNGGNANNFLVAVSNDANPLNGWSGAAIDSDSDDTHWADFPTLGLNGNKVTISANMFATSGNSGTFTSFLTLDKANLIGGTVTATLFEGVNPNSTGFTAQPVFDNDNGTGAHQILSSFNKPSGVLKTSSISGAAGSATLNTSGGFVSVTARSGPSDAAQPAPGPVVDNGDTRFSGNVVLQNGSLWGVHTVDVSGRSALEWYQVNATTNALIQSGLIQDADLEFYYPSIAVNDDGDVVIGFSGSSANQFISAYAVVGETALGTTTFTDEILLKAGLDTYVRTDSGGRNRWGDYSATVLDPSDASGKTFWTFQEFVNADGTSGTSNNVWSTQITEIIIPEPASFALLVLGDLLLTPRRRR